MNYEQRVCRECQGSGKALAWMYPSRLHRLANERGV